MELTVSTPAILFSTVSLLMIAFTNRFLAIASLIRDLHEKFRTNPDSVYVAQIQNLHRRLFLIRNMQIISILSLLLSAICMLVIFQGSQPAARWLFVSALLLQIVALGISVVEISISINALKIELSDIEHELTYPSLEATRERFFSRRNKKQK
ncbi:DUF2721 domain-containing protein [Arsenicibacter rosenii]|uniref:DUF2721 domain-containing protein n=1 Tax=Arsenicibacter rosenii TaxID=1750698 RepID=A0A1S2VLM2_9BACT|nr:DUF2721 domain-containing protein [Arsenicibacter rosenii]OIN59639.1 hypothetical protein BLX24_07145 [Arsenicibacter rosenii]